MIHTAHDIDPALFSYLATTDVQTPHAHLGYNITPIRGGANNKLVRATAPGCDIAVKLSARDFRDRAGREHNALRWLDDALPGHAPRSLLLDRDGYAHALNVQSWIDGHVHETPPDDPALWRAVGEHYAAIHTLSRTDANAHARAIGYDATVMMRSAADGLDQTIQRQLDQFPAEGRSSEFDALFARARSIRWPEWPRPADVLCHADINIRNLIVRADGRLTSIDWEYSGWGDGANDIASLIAMPSDQPLSDSNVDALIEAYCAHSRPDARMRIAIYLAIHLIWWVARFDRLLYQVPRELDERLAARPADWQAIALRRRAERIARADAALARFEGQDGVMC
jgi:thiamine kinase-like enzyme